MALGLGAQWHGYSGSMVISEAPNLGDLAEKLEQLGWWLEAPSPSRTPPAANRPWEQITLEVGASLMGASLGEPLGRWLGASLAGPPGAAAGSFLGLVLGAVLATETLDQQRNRGKIADELSQVKTRVRGRVAGRLGEEAGALAGLRIGGLLGGPLGASAGGFAGHLVGGSAGGRRCPPSHQAVAPPMAMAPPYRQRRRRGSRQSEHLRPGGRGAFEQPRPQGWGTLGALPGAPR